MLSKFFPSLEQKKKKELGSAVRLREMVDVLRKYDVVRGLTPEKLRKAADDLDVINAAGRAAYIEKAGDKLTEEALEKFMDDETWLTAEQCIELGLADRYAEKDADMSGAAQMLQKANLNISQRIELNRSLAAQLRELTNQPAQKQPQETAQTPETAPEAAPKTEEVTKKSFMQLFANI